MNLENVNKKIKGEEFMKKLTLKNLNWYRIFMASMMIATLAIAIWVGVSAVQKSMKMKLSLQVDPTTLVKIEDSNSNVLFCNTTKDGQKLEVGEGTTLSGNMLTINKNFGNLGAEFSLKVYNYTTLSSANNVLKVAVSGTGVESTNMWLPSYSGSQVQNGVINITAVVGTINITFEEVEKPTFAINLTVENCSTTAQSEEKIYGEDYAATFTANSGYVLPDTITVTGISSGGYSWDKSTGVFAITDWTKVTGNISISCVAKLPYTIKTYGEEGAASLPAGTGSTFQGYKYIEMGKYPQTYKDNNTSITGYNDNDNSNSVTTGDTYTDASGEYYYQTKVNYGTAGWYKFEPIRWIIIGAGSDKTDTYGDGANIKVQGELDADQLLLLSEYGLEMHVFHNSSMNQFANSDLKTFLNGTFAERSGLKDYICQNVGETNKLIAKVTPKTTYADSSNNKKYDEGSSYNIFCLGYSNGNQTDTYDVNSYLTTNSAPKKAIATGFAQTSGAYTSSNYCHWWLRSGLYDYSYSAYYVRNSGSVSTLNVDYSSGAVRPSFVLNLA